MGGDKSDKKSSSEKKTAVAQPVVKYQTYGTALDPMVQQQLLAGGLGGILGPANQFAPVSVPILNTPQDLEALLKAQGQKPTTVKDLGGMSGGGSAAPAQQPVSFGDTNRMLLRRLGKV